MIPQLEISTYEIAHTVAEALYLLARRKRGLLASETLLSAVSRLISAARYAQSSLMVLSGDVEPKRGWCSDHPYGQPLIESWTTANVLQSAISLQMLLEEVDRASILNTFVVIDPHSEDWPPWLEWESYMRENEPDHSYPILKYLDEIKRLLASETLLSAVSRLISAARYAQSSLMVLSGDVEPKRGWCSDHPYGQPLIESWTTANVLQSAISLQMLLEEVDRASILNTFVVIDPHSEDWPPWLEWESYMRENEPDHSYPILKYLDEHIIQPINSSTRGLPSAENESVSALLFGPPGTSKTTIVKAVATGLGWPVVLLSPGDFIKEGLEYIEAQARSLFSRLQRLSRAVVLFDECDELFRNRKPSEEAEQTRGIAAFVTASMLPKLQELHDRGKVVFFICTNKFETLDPAVKRGGRIDHIIGVGPPDEEARKRIIEHVLGVSKPKSTAGRIAEELAIRTERFSRSEIVRACRILKNQADLNDLEQGKKTAQAIAKRMENSLNIGIEDLKLFNQLRDQASRPVTEARN